MLLADAREEPDKLLYPADAKREPRAFTITLARAMGHKRGKAEGSFVRETRAQTFDFYREIVQQLKPWQARPPKLRGPDAKQEVRRSGRVVGEVHRGSVMSMPVQQR